MLVFLVVFFSGFDVFVKGNFTAAGFITCYINIAIFAGKPRSTCEVSLVALPT